MRFVFLVHDAGDVLRALVLYEIEECVDGLLPLVLGQVAVGQLEREAVVLGVVLDELAQAQVEPEGEHQEDDADLRQLLGRGVPTRLTGRMMTQGVLDSAGRDAILAEVARLIAGFLQDEPAR